MFRVEEGLGNACLLELPDGRCGFLDWGTQREEPLEAALSVAAGRGVCFIVASHAHADHTLGLRKLIETCQRRRIPIEKLVYPASTLHLYHAEMTQARLEAHSHGIPTMAVSVDSFAGPQGKRQPPWLAWGQDGSWDVRVLSPSDADVASAEIRALKKQVVPGNETSLVILFRFTGDGSTSGVGRAVLPGDATRATLSRARETGKDFPTLTLDNQVLLVPHHGSAHNLPDWLGSYVEGVALVSAPTGSKHHPSRQALKKLASWTCTPSARGLFCTSYAHQCGAAFGSAVADHERRLIAQGSCFADIVVEIPREGPATVVKTSGDGTGRRKFGFCGNP